MDLTKLSLSSSQKQELHQLIERALKRNEWKVNPLLYFQERLGIRPETIDWSLLPAYKDHKWDGTPNPLKQIIDGLAANQWVGVESATGVGKTFLGACIVLWFLESFPNSIVVTTAPKQDQLSLHLWKEISKLYSAFAFGELLSLELRMKEQSEE